jgi:hypothetical protein
MATQKQTSGYGAISNSEEEEKASEGFDSNNTYYLTDNGSWTCRKLFLMAVPLLGAALIIGGAVWYLLSDFNHLYPGPGPTTTGSRSEGHTIRVPPPPPVPAIAPSPQKVTQKVEQKSNNENSKSDDAASCISHPACSGLIGDCCPTSAGVLLDCCN